MGEVYFCSQLCWELHISLLSLALNTAAMGYVCQSPGSLILHCVKGRGGEKNGVQGSASSRSPDAMGIGRAVFSDRRPKETCLFCSTCSRCEGPRSCWEHLIRFYLQWVHNVAFNG